MLLCKGSGCRTSTTVLNTSADPLLSSPPENAEWLLGHDKLNIVMTRIGNMDNLPYMAVVVKTGDPSVKIMSELCLTELDALRDLFEELGKQVGHKLKAEGECEIVDVGLDAC